MLPTLIMLAAIALPVIVLPIIAPLPVNKLPARTLPFLSIYTGPNPPTTSIPPTLPTGVSPEIRIPLPITTLLMTLPAILAYPGAVTLLEEMPTLPIMAELEEKAEADTLAVVIISVVIGAAFGPDVTIGA